MVLGSGFGADATGGEGATTGGRDGAQRRRCALGLSALLASSPIQLQSAFVVCQRPAAIAFHFVGEGAVPKGCCEAGIEPDRLVVVGNRAVVVLLGVVGTTTVVEGLGVAGIEADRLVVVGDRAVVVLLGVVGAAAVVEGLAFAGIEPDRLVEVGNRAVVVLLGVVGEAAVVEGPANLSMPDLAGSRPCSCQSRGRAGPSCPCPRTNRSAAASVRRPGQPRRSPPRATRRWPANTHASNRY